MHLNKLVVLKSFCENGSAMYNTYLYEKFPTVHYFHKITHNFYNTKILKILPITKKVVVIKILSGLTDLFSKVIPGSPTCGSIRQPGSRITWNILCLTRLEMIMIDNYYQLSKNRAVCYRNKSSVCICLSVGGKTK